MLWLLYIMAVPTFFLALCVLFKFNFKYESKYFSIKVEVK
ncbi:hypothetical protein LZ11_01466 [Thermosediminibacter litoriperuensis]|uniref:Uncharacterized protein n=1 Tax=Thermosediminibacter litoriperuensis TaxID=291989 RepID=A0A5S5ASF1_9FIRM|nr:hypothetical protein LZ11_01466 [Thermosediminibacter litoriperuensis]